MAGSELGCSDAALVKGSYVSQLSVMQMQFGTLSPREGSRGYEREVWLVGWKRLAYAS